jgi:hypothetical protein
MCGRQTGNYPHALFSVFGVRNTGGGLAKEALARVEWGMRFTHEILRQAASPLEEVVRRFGYGQPGCTVLHYWDRTEGTGTDPGLELSNPNVRWLGLLKPAEKKLLVVLVNWTSEPQTADVRLVGPLKSRNVVWRDAETGVELTNSGVALQGWQVRLLEASQGSARGK